MTINISSKQMDVTPAIRAHIEERLAKLNKWQTQLINPHFMIHKQPNGYEVEVSIGTPVGDLFAKAHDADLYKAINDVEAKLETQLNKQKHKGEARRADESIKKLNEHQ
ncbi:MAG: ribosome-associated translation inhibitor RaiA [Pasteurellaceae bacterium]|nr:ribosome-associated translation inhibitor RaiA [Pasteurellaceae bacterium]